MSMSDEITASSAATAQTLSALGYGMFAWLQPGELEQIHDLGAVTQAMYAEGVLADVEAAGNVSTTLLGLTELGPVPDTLFDEDLAAAEMLAELALDDADEQPAEAEVAEPALPDEAMPSSYSTHRDTIAMLEEIAFLDE